MSSKNNISLLLTLLLLGLLAPVFFWLGLMRGWSKLEVLKNYDEKASQVVMTQPAKTNAADVKSK